MVLIIPSTANGWPQSQIDHEKDLMASTGRIMEKPSQEQHQNQGQQQALKCPRCDSSNTKFCYYNNYSLSQPRHFCKACKRYWTRGGTLRSVPVGGGCRKNKRVVKRAVEPSSSSNHVVSPLFYGSVSDADTVLGFDLLQPHMNIGSVESGFRNAKGFDSNKQTQEAFVSNSLLPSYSMFGSSTTSTYPTMASFLASSLHQQQKNCVSNGLQGFSELPMVGRQHEAGTVVEEVKMEENHNRLDWNYVPFQNQTEPICPSEPSLYWHGTNVGAWLDPAYIGF